MQIVATTMKEWVRLFDYLDVNIASWASAGANFTLTCELNSGASLHPGWNSKSQFLSSPNPTIS
jgi:hypothetical protein